MDSIAIKSGWKPWRRLKTVLWILFVILILTSILVLVNGIGSEIIGILLLFLGLTDLIVLYVLADKYYNWSLIFFLAFFIGIFCKRQHWPGASVIAVLGVMAICITSIANSIRFQLTIKENPFLK